MTQNCITFWCRNMLNNITFSELSNLKGYKSNIKLSFKKHNVTLQFLSKVCCISCGMASSTRLFDQTGLSVEKVLKNHINLWLKTLKFIDKEANLSHYNDTPMQYIAILQDDKNGYSSKKKKDTSFSQLCSQYRLWYTCQNFLTVSNKCLQSIFQSKNNVYSCNPQFSCYYIKVGCIGV